MSAELLTEWTPIFAQTHEFKLLKPKVTIQRKQFPVQQATGKTVHKAQGSTVPEVVVSVGDYTFRNSFYVACNRVPKLENLHLLNFHPNQIKTDRKVDAEMIRLNTTRKLNLNFVTFPLGTYPFQIYYSNIQSLYTHHKYIINDDLVKQSNILLFNESHLHENDLNLDYLIPHFDMIRFDGIDNLNHRHPSNGLAAYIRHGCEFFTLNTIRTERFEYMINDINNKDMHLTTVLLYVKPRTQKWVIKNMFEEIMHEIFLFQNILIIGDFNIDYEQNYDFIENLAEAHNLNVGPNTDTTLNSTCIDYCFSRQTVSINTHFIQWSYHFSFTVAL